MKTIYEFCEESGLSIYRLAKDLDEQYHTIRKRAVLGWSMWVDGEKLYMRSPSTGATYEYEISEDATF